MNGIELFKQIADKKGYIIGDVDTSKGETNGDFTITNTDGVVIKQNHKKLSETYGTLIWFHFNSEEAMNQIYEFIDIQFEVL